jgi:hypothetical protein
MDENNDNIQILQRNIEFVNDKVEKVIDVLTKLNSKVDDVFKDVFSVNEINTLFSEKTLDFMEITKSKIQNQELIITELVNLSKKMSERIFEMQEIINVLSNLTGIDSNFSKKIKTNQEQIDEINLNMDSILDKINLVGLKNLTEQEKNYITKK